MVFLYDGNYSVFKSPLFFPSIFLNHPRLLYYSNDSTPRRRHLRDLELMQSRLLCDPRGASDGD